MPRNHKPNPLSSLPIHIRQIPGSKWFVNSHTGAKVSPDQALRLANEAVNRVVQHESIIDKRWDLKY